MIVVSWGAGTDSTSLVIEALRRGIRPDLIAFADTGSEMPHTYEFIKEFSLWLSLRGLSLDVVKWIRQDGTFTALDEECLRDGDLPSRAYGLSGCTGKYKQQPIDGFVRRHPLFKEAIARGEVVERWMGYGADEPTRGRSKTNPQYDFFKKPEPWIWRAPLRDWGIGREESIALIDRAGLSQPGKSSCWLCPNMRESEIFGLAQHHPELMARALKIEDKARPGLRGGVKGLGRSFAWRDLLEGKPCEVQRGEDPCGCHDDYESRLFEFRKGAA